MIHVPKTPEAPEAPDIALERPDDFYAALLDAHQGLTTEQSQALNARLVLLLANTVGRFDALQRVLAQARAAIG